MHAFPTRSSIEREHKSMQPNNDTSSLEARVLGEADLDHAWGGIGMASMAAKPLIPDIKAVLEQYAKVHPTGQRFQAAEAVEGLSCSGPGSDIWSSEKNSNHRYRDSRSEIVNGATGRTERRPSGKSGGAPLRTRSCNGRCRGEDRGTPDLVPAG
jgi:hypothetical protein